MVMGADRRPAEHNREAHFREVNHLPPRLSASTSRPETLFGEINRWWPRSRLERSRFAADAFACCGADGRGDL